MENLEIVNRRLLESFGRGVNELPLYRIVWSTSQMEKRYGTFIKETEAGIYLGQETCEREVPKYSYCPDQWILEWVQPNINNRELLAKISYEPLWVFWDRYGRSLPYDWDIILILVKNHQKRVELRTDAMIRSAEQDAMDKEAEENLDRLKGEAQPFHGKLSNHEAIVVPNKEFR